jgi:N-acetylglucosaminyldiphosphoundecaprenol N-acetyl-beta-D-mannosaminyltransferase
MSMIERDLTVSLREEHAAAGSSSGSEQRVDVLGCPVDALDMEGTVKRCLELIERRAGAQHVVVNAAKLVEADRNPRLAAIVRGCELVNADGQAVVWAARLLGRRLPERVAGIDLMHKLMDAAAERGLGVYVLGARDHVLTLALDRLRQRHPGLRVVGAHHGYFGAEDEERIRQEIRTAAPEILFVAMSSPQKEYWLADNLQRLGVPLAMGVGGAVDVAAGVTRRAPVWMQRAGLEWVFRLIQEPRRLWRRYLTSNVRFLLLVGRGLRAARRTRRAP